MAYFFINMIYFKILNTQRVFQQGIYSSMKIEFYGFSSHIYTTISQSQSCPFKVSNVVVFTHYVQNDLLDNFVRQSSHHPLALYWKTIYSRESMSVRAPIANFNISLSILSIRKCFEEGIFMVPLGDKFFKLALQIISRSVCLFFRLLLITQFSWSLIVVLLQT